MLEKWSDSEKAGVALMAIREEKPISETAQETGAHPNMISNMKELGLKGIVPKRCL